MAIDFQKLVSLLDSPRELSIAIESLRANEDLDESIRGFIAMYDQFKGDTLAMKLQMLTHNKNQAHRQEMLEYLQVKAKEFHLVKE